MLPKITNQNFRMAFLFNNHRHKIDYNKLILVQQHFHPNLHDYYRDVKVAITEKNYKITVFDNITAIIEKYKHKMSSNYLNVKLNDLNAMRWKYLNLYAPK